MSNGLKCTACGVMERETQGTKDTLCSKCYLEKRAHVCEGDCHCGPDSILITLPVKPDYSLIPADALEEIAKVFTDGTKKYASNGWLDKFTWSHYFSKIMRHLWAFWRGKDKDPESGLSHIAHAGADLMILLAYYLRKINKDDRR